MGHSMSNNLSVNQQYYKNQNVQQPSFTADGKPVVVQNNPLLNAATTEHGNPAVLLGGAVATGAGLMYINNKINNPLLTQNYNDTFYKKVEEAVDKFGNKKTVQNISKKTNAANKWFIENVVNKSEVLKTLWTKNSIGRNFAQQQAAGTNGHLASKAIEVMKEYKTQNPDFKGFDAILKKASEQSYKHYDEIIKTIQNSGADLNQTLATKPKWGLGLVKNKATLKEILNKDILIQNYKASGKTLGQKAAGYLMRGAECVTNGVFSGKGAVLLQALFLSMSISEAMKAEKGEKFSTLMASWTELMAFMATAALQVRVINKAAALKYIGMSKENVDKLHKAVRIGNEAAKQGNAKAYLKMQNVINELKANAKQNIKWYQKPAKWIGNIIGWARPNETLMPLSKKGFNLSKLARGTAKLKTAAGFAGRMALVMAVVIPVFSGAAKKLSYAIFGKPVKTLEKEKLAAEAAEQSTAKQDATNAIPNTLEQPQQKTTQQPVQRPLFTQQPQQTSKPGNLFDMMQHPQQSQQIASQSLNQPIASTPIQQSPDAQIKRTYIPNPILGAENITSLAATRTARIDEVLRQADFAEANAQKYM